MDEQIQPVHANSIPVACRWLARYPIKPEEVLAALERIDDSDGIGGLCGMIKRGLITFFKDDPDSMAKIIEHLKVK